MPQIPRHAFELPPRPEMPTSEDEWRSIHQRARIAILEEDHDEVVKAWLRNYVREETLDGWGEPDISWNPLASYARKMTTPGRYWKTPTLSHGVGDAVDGFVRAVTRAGYWTKRQAISLRTEGVGDDVVRFDLVRGRLVVRIVSPGDVYVEMDPHDPERELILWELQPRWLPDPVEEDKGQWIWAWDQYHAGGVDERGRDRPPSWRVVEAPSVLDPTRPPRDLSGVFLVRPDGTRGPLEGWEGPHRYPFLDPAERERVYSGFVPYTRYRSIDSGRVWNWKENRGLHRGTLHVSAYATYAGRSALDASGSFAIAWGLELPADSEQSDGAQAPTRYVQARPGTIIFAQPSGNGQPGVKIMGPAANLEAIGGWMRSYMEGQHSQKGLGRRDAQKTAANPTSGAALYITDKERQEYQERTEPLDRRSDLDAVRKMALVCNAGTGSSYPTEGYSIQYPRRRRAPQEEREEREEQEWELAQKQKSQVQVFMQRNPGTTRDDAIRALAQVLADEAALAREAERLGVQLRAAPAAPAAPPTAPLPPE